MITKDKDSVTSNYYVQDCQRQGNREWYHRALCFKLNVRKESDKEKGTEQNCYRDEICKTASFEHLAKRITNVLPYDVLRLWGSWYYYV